MDDEDWGEDDIKEFVRMVKKSENTWKLPSEELKVINLGTEKDKKELKIGTLITAKGREGLISLLHEYADVFAWTYANMLGLDTDRVVHRISLVEGSRLVKQKTRRMRPDILLKVKAEIQK